MKIIELLNKIANGEEVPDAIKWGCHDFEWFVYEYKAKGELGEPTLLDYLSQCPQMLNDRIITFNKVEEEKKIPEKICTNRIVNTKDILEFEMIQNKINAEYTYAINCILDYLKSKGE